MSTKKGFPFALILITLVIGSAIVRDFDAENLTFEKPALAVVYIVTFVVSVYLIVKDVRGK